MSMLDRAGAAPAFEEELVGAAPEVDREEGLESRRPGVPHARLNASRSG